MKNIIMFLFCFCLVNIATEAQVVIKPPTQRTAPKQSKATVAKPQQKQAQSAVATPSSSLNRQRILQELANNMVYVQGGTFIMGATSEQGSDVHIDEKPAHYVTLSGYYICKYEVTQELWQCVMGSNPSSFKGAQRPVENVRWNDCQSFISKLNSLTGMHYRLPTEAEWEYAARGGNRSKGYKYSGSNYIDNVTWYEGNSGETHNVGSLYPNELGIYDMSGNVWEWCQDWYSENYYSNSPSTNPTGPYSGSSRVLRSGSWRSGAWYCRSSHRAYYSPGNRGNHLGFRLALSE